MFSIGVGVGIGIGIPFNFLSIPIPIAIPTPILLRQRILHHSLSRSQKPQSALFPPVKQAEMAPYHFRPTFPVRGIKGRFLSIFD
jgi:hypothetical protein